MKVQNLAAFNVVGFIARTCNQNEMEAKQAKIGKLWQTFFAQAGSKIDKNTKVYGVYTNYETDYHGYYDIIAGADTLSETELANTGEQVCSIQIKSGKYLTFSATGAMPETALTLWQEIWQYFDQPDCPHKRAYTTDFEYYKSKSENESEIEISIAII